MTKWYRFFSLLMVFLCSCAPIKTQQVADYYSLFSVEAEFEGVRDELVEVIEEKGMVISFVSHAAKMLERTQSTSEIKGNLYVEAEVLLFCKADLSHQLAASDSHSLILCPQAITIYTLKKEPKIVYMSIRNAPKNLDAYQAIFELLTGIIQQVIEEYE